MKFSRYIKLLNKSSYNSIVITSIIILVLNIMMILDANKFVAIYDVPVIYPDLMYYKMSMWFNIPIILMFIITLITDYLSSMRYLGFVGGKIKNNRSIFTKLKALSSISIILYLITIINGYLIYLNIAGDTSEVISILQVLFNTSIPLIFIVSLNVMVIVLTKANTIALAMIMAIYLIIERYYPILNLFDYVTCGGGFSEVFKMQIIHGVMAVFFIFVVFKKSRRYE